jgi:hypothetical protein
MPEVEPFDHFLTRIRSARPAQYREALSAAAGLPPHEADAEFEKMKAWLLSHYQGVHPLRSYLNQAGQTIDCVPFEQQPAVQAARRAGQRLPAAPPPRTGTAQHRAGADTPARTMREEEPCPDACVPMVRITLERLVQLGTLDNFFRKSPTISPPDAG